MSFITSVCVAPTTNPILFETFNSKVPTFGHHPLLLNNEGKNLGKRSGSLSLKDLKDWQFEIAKNHNGNLYLYSDDSLQSSYVT